VLALAREHRTQLSKRPIYKDIYVYIYTYIHTYIYIYAAFLRLLLRSALTAHNVRLSILILYLLFSSLAGRARLGRAARALALAHEVSENGNERSQGATDSCFRPPKYLLYSATLPLPRPRTRATTCSALRALRSPPLPLRPHPLAAGCHREVRFLHLVAIPI
jgi:hypothetical protein